VHERVRQHSLAVTREVKEGLATADELLERLRSDPIFTGVDFSSALNPTRFVGRSPEQVVEFLDETVISIQRRYSSRMSGRSELQV
jgi:adenylosuccinate lyase